MAILYYKNRIISAPGEYSNMGNVGRSKQSWAWVPGASQVSCVDLASLSASLRPGFLLYEVRIIIPTVVVMGASPVVQWLRIRLPMQGTRVRALVREDSTCRGATKPVRHNYWACALEPMSHNYWARAPRALALQQREATAMRSPCTATKSSPCSPQLEKAHVQQQRLNAAKNKIN